MVQASFIRLKQLARVLATIAVAFANVLRAELRTLLRHFGEVHSDNDRGHADWSARGAIRVPTVIVAVNFAQVPKKRPKLCAKNIRERDGNRCQYTGALLRPDEGSLDHVVPRSRGGPDTWENLVWSSKQVNTRKGNRLPHEAGLKLLSMPRAPKELPVTALIRNAQDIADWKLFVKE